MRPSVVVGMATKDSKGFATELKRGTLELILLHLLDERPKYGYELVRELQSGDEIQIKEGTVYPVLYRLEERGLVAPEWQARSRGVPRKYYQLTEGGRSRLQELQREWKAYIRWVEGAIAPRAPVPEVPVPEVPVPEVPVSTGSVMPKVSTETVSDDEQ